MRRYLNKIDLAKTVGIQQPCRYQPLPFSTMYENNRNGPKLAQIAVHMVPWGLPKHIGKFNIESSY